MSEAPAPVLDLDVELTLRDFRLAIRLATASARVALFGASGSGKTLTLEVIAGLRAPGSGYARVLGRTFFDAEAGTDLPPQARRVGYVPQAYHLFPHMTAAANVAYGQRRPQQGKVAELLERVGLSDVARRRPHELSGGQRQRVAFARALAGEPDVLLLDEPFAALDQPVRRRLRGALATLLRELPTPSVLVTHDLVEATLLADTIVVVRDGRVVQVADGDDLMRHPVDAYVADLVGMSNRLQATVVTRGERSAWVRWGDETLEVAAALSAAEGGRVTLGIRPEFIRLLGPGGTDRRPTVRTQHLAATLLRLEREGLEDVLTLRTSAGHALEVRRPIMMPTPPGAPDGWRPQVGEHVLLEAAPHDLWPLGPERPML